MGNTLKLKTAWLLLLIMLPFYHVVASSGADEICGQWLSEQKNVLVEVYRDGNSYKARLLWFNDTDDPSRPMAIRTDYKNPDKSLRSRHLIGMNVLNNLTYDSSTNTWEHGMIYDAKNGHEWSSCASLEDNGTLKVTGYWHFKFIGKSMYFKRVNNQERMALNIR